MMKELKRSQRLQSVGKLAADHEQKALTSLAEVQKALRQAEDQLATIQQYHAQYRQTLGSGESGVLSAGLLTEYQRFLANLEKSMEIQQQQILSLRTKLAEAQKNYHKRKARRKAVDKVQTRLLTKAEVKLRRLEQKQQDEYAQKLKSSGQFGSLFYKR